MRTVLGYELEGIVQSFGFSIAGVVVVVAGLVIIGGMLFYATVAQYRIADGNNGRRQFAVNSILEEIHRYAARHNGELPSNIPIADDCVRSGLDICDNDTCRGLQLSMDSSLRDPLARTHATGYRVSQRVDGRVVVCAPFAENGANIQVTQ